MKRNRPERAEDNKKRRVSYETEEGIGNVVSDFEMEIKETIVEKK